MALNLMKLRPALLARRRASPTGRPSANVLAADLTERNASERVFRSIDLIVDRCLTLRCRDLVDCRHAESVGPLMRDIESLVEIYLAAERDLVAVVDSAGGALPLPDCRTVTVGRAEFDAYPVGGANEHG